MVIMHNFSKNPEWPSIEFHNVGFRGSNNDVATLSSNSKKAEDLK